MCVCTLARADRDWVLKARLWRSDLRERTGASMTQEKDWIFQEARGHCLRDLLTHGTHVRHCLHECQKPGRMQPVTPEVSMLVMWWPLQLAVSRGKSLRTGSQKPKWPSPAKRPNSWGLLPRESTCLHQAAAAFGRLQLPRAIPTHPIVSVSSLPLTARLIKWALVSWSFCPILSVWRTDIRGWPTNRHGQNQNRGPGTVCPKKRKEIHFCNHRSSGLNPHD